MQFDYWNNLLLLSAFTSGISELVDRYWHLDGYPSAIRTLVLGVVVGVVGSLSNLGMFADFTAVCSSNSAIVCGALVGLYSGVTAAVAWLTGLLRVLWQFLGIRPVEGTVQSGRDVRPFWKLFSK